MNESRDHDAHALLAAIERSMDAGFEALNRRLDDATAAISAARAADARTAEQLRVEDRARIDRVERESAELSGRLGGLERDLTRGLEAIRETIKTEIREVAEKAADGREALHRRIDDLDGPVSGRVTRLENRQRVVAAWVAAAALVGGAAGSGWSQIAGALPMPLSALFSSL